MHAAQDLQFAKLSRAPIVEGLIDFRLRPLEPTSLEQLSQLEAQLHGTYATKKEIRTFEAAINIGAEAGQQVISSEQLIGYRYESNETPFVFQARIDGFTVSRLAPYTGWEDLLAETKRLWEIYSDTVKNATVIRIAVRYINKINFPAPTLDFDEYLTAGPKIPEKLPQGLTEFLTRTVVPFHDYEATAILIQAFEPPQPASTVLPVVLDIDVFHEGAYDSQGIQFWKILEDLRGLKNKIFFAAITETTLGLIK